MDQQLKNITSKHMMFVGKNIQSIFVACCDVEEHIEVKCFSSFDEVFSCGVDVTKIKVIFEDSSWSTLEKVKGDFVWQYCGD